MECGGREEKIVEMLWYLCRSSSTYVKGELEVGEACTVDESSGMEEENDWVEGT